MLLLLIGVHWLVKYLLNMLALASNSVMSSLITGLEISAGHQTKSNIKTAMSNAKSPYT